MFSFGSNRPAGQAVIILTGHGGGDAASEGVAAVLIKPAATGELVRTIRSVLDRRLAARVS